MRAIHINATDKTITEVEHSGEYEDIKKVVEPGKYIEAVYCIPNHHFYIDEEGKLHNAHTAGFVYAGFNDVIHGSAIIFGNDSTGEGDEAPATVNLDAVKRRILWVRIDNEAKLYHTDGRGTD